MTELPAGDTVPGERPVTDPQAAAALAAAAVREWLPVNAASMEPRVRQKIEPTVRSCVEEAAPHSVAGAHRMLRVSFGAFEGSSRMRSE